MKRKRMAKRVVSGCLALISFLSTALSPAVGIQSKHSAWDCSLCFSILFHYGYFHFLTVILENCFLLDHRCLLILIGKGHCLYFLVQHKALPMLRNRHLRRSLIMRRSKISWIRTRSLQQTIMRLRLVLPLILLLIFPGLRSRMTVR